MSKAITNEEIIAALLSRRTIKEAAAAVGLSERAVYDRMNGPEFKLQYQEARADLVRAAVVSLQEHLQAAIDTVADIMADPENNPAVRLQAAQTIINTQSKYVAGLQAAEREADITRSNNRVFGIE